MSVNVISNITGPARTECTEYALFLYKRFFNTYILQKDHIESYVKAGLDLYKLADPLAGTDLCSSAAGLLTVGLNCVRPTRQDRPDMASVLKDVAQLYNNYRTIKANCKKHLYLL